MNETKTIMLVGVGGQGTLLASRILGRLMLDAGFDVKVSEVHGMSQRGGSVVTYIRWGDSVASPLVAQGEADIILSFELCEAARWLSCLKPNGFLLSNNQQIMPMPVITGAATYPEAIEAELKKLCKNVVVVDALTPALQAGNSRSVNVVLLGLLSDRMDFPEAAWQAALAACMKPQLLAVNQLAFSMGRSLSRTMGGSAHV
ncbi:MAG: indolepyruvate oxidoreductase subunit beta [Angelakisella sp.]